MKYPDFVDVDPQSGSHDWKRTSIGSDEGKEQSPGPSSVKHSKDSDSGHGVEVTDTASSKPVTASANKDDDDDNDNTDISPGEEIVVVESASDMQLQESIPEEEEEVEPAPLDFKSSSLTQEELEEMKEDNADESLGQFPLATSTVVDSKGDAVSKNTLEAESSQSPSQEPLPSVSGDEDISNKSDLKSIETDPKSTTGEAGEDDDDFGDFDDFKSSTFQGASRDCADADVVAASSEADNISDDIKDSTTAAADEDQWAAFGDDKTPTNNGDGDGGWADFQEPPPPPNDDEDDFGDFGDVEVVSKPPPDQDLVRLCFYCV